MVLVVHPSVVFGFGKAPYSQTSWRFEWLSPRAG